jgi:hypothetical protein
MMQAASVKSATVVESTCAEFPTTLNESPIRAIYRSPRVTAAIREGGKVIGHVVEVTPATNGAELESPSSLTS